MKVLKLIFFGFIFLLFSYPTISQRQTVGEEVIVEYESPHPYSTSSESEQAVVWKQEIKYAAKKATYIAVHFAQFNIAVGDKLVIRSLDNESYWEYTSEDNKRVSFWSIPIYGDKAIIEIVSSNSRNSFGYDIDKIARGFTQEEIQNANSFRTICGEDDSEEAKCYEISEPIIYENSRAVARLWLNGIENCTGWLVGDEGHLMTCDHCIRTESEANNSTVEMMAEGTDCSINCKAPGLCPGDIVATSVEVIQTSCALDYSLVLLPDNVSDTYGFLTMKGDGPAIDDQIYIPQHPLGWGKRIAFVSDNENDTDGTIQIQTLTKKNTWCYGVDDYNRVGYYGDTRMGSSGSPVISYKDHCVVAVHGSGGCLNGGANTNLIIADLNYIPNNSIYDHCGTAGDIHLYDDTEYNFDMQVNGNIFVYYGVELNVTAKLEFGLNKSIIVKPGGKLVVDGGGLLTNCPQVDKWQGVHLESPLAFYLTFTDPGIIEMKNGGTIENAVTGIDTRNSYSPLYQPGYTYEHGGGVVNMESGAKIENCGTGIHFARFGWGSASNPSQYMAEQSVINNSFISNCDVGIYMDNNIGLEVNGTVFTDNWPDVEPHMSSFDFTGNTFHYGIEMYAEYPSFRGANIIGNNFVGVHDVGSKLTIESHSNAEPVIFDNNSTFNFGMIVDGDLNFLARENDFYDGTGIQAWASGDFQANMVERNSFYGNEYGSSVDGVNDIEYLNNCFENTTKDDIEVGNGAKIHKAQGDPVLRVSAGNCFNKRIRTGNNSVEFDYWTETGYETEPNPNWYNCRYPGDGNLIRRQALSGDQDDNLCGTQVNYTGPLLAQYRDCKCGPLPKDCIDLVEALKDEIVRLGNDLSINQWVRDWLIAKYIRCINENSKSVAKLLIKEGRTDDAINYLSAQPSFRLRIMAYALMMNAHEIERAMIYLNSLNTDGEGEQDFVNSQNIYLNYLSNRDGYALNKTDRNYLLSVARDKNPYSGYVRSIYYKLTGEKIKIEFVHLDGTKSTTRAISNNTDSRLIVYPNPLDGEYFTISIDEFDFNSKYSIVIRSIDGRIVTEAKLDNAENQINIDKKRGVFLIQLFENNALISTEKLVKL